MACRRPHRCARRAGEAGPTTANKGVFAMNGSFVVAQTDAVGALALKKAVHTVKRSNRLLKK